MKRRHLLLVALGLILTICMCFSLACGKSKKSSDPVTLTAPVVSVDNTNGKATWDEVENASGYAYKINDGEEKTGATKTDGKYTVQLTDGQSIKVKALGDGKNYLDSSWSTAKTYNAGSTGDGHTCGHVCTESGCGKCTDNTCTDPVCANNRCPGHGSDVTPSSDYGTQDNPLSVTEALALADKECVDDGDFTKQYVYATGKVSNVPTKDPTKEYYSNVTLADLTDSSKTILVYTINVDADVAAPAQNDTLVIYGYITNYKGTIEFAGNGSDYVYIKSNTRGTSTVTLGAHDGADVTGLPETKTNGETVEFTVTPQSGRAIDSVTVYGNPATVVDEATGKYNFVVAGNATVTVDTRDANTAAATEIVTLDFSVAEYSEYANNYSSTVSASQDGVTWNLSKFNTGSAENNWDHVRTGHGTNAIEGTITTDVAWADTVTKVIVAVKSISDANVAKVKSFRLEVASDANFTNIVETVSITIAQGNNEFKILNPVANHYYRIAVDCDVAANGFVQISSVTYWGHLAEEGSIKDPDKVNEGKVSAALKAIKLNPAEYSTIETGIQLDNTSGDVALTWTVKNTVDTEWVVINNNVLDILKLPDADEKEIILNVHLSLGNAEDDKEIVLTLLPSGAKGTASNPYTIAEAVALAKTLSSTDWSNTAVYATGYVVNLGTWYTDHWGSVIIADTLGAKRGDNDAIIVYNLYPDGTYLANNKDALELGATITVHGYLKNYSGNTPEFDTNGSTKTTAVAYTAPSDEAKADFALALLPDLEESYSSNFTVSTTSNGLTVTWSAVAGAGGGSITFQGGSATVVRGDDDTVVTVTASVSYGASLTKTRNFTVTVTKKPADGVEEEGEVYALTTSNQGGGSNNNYASNCDVTVNSVTWNIEGNAQENPWRFGGKSLSTATDRALTSTTPITGQVTKVNFTFLGKTITNNNILSDATVTFNVGTTSGGKDVYTTTVNYSKGGTVTIAAPANANWTDCYYQVVFSVTNDTTTNKFVGVETLQFLGYGGNSGGTGGGTTDPDPDDNDPGGTVSVTIANLGWNNGSKYTSLEIGKVTATVAGGSNSGNAQSSASEWRIYYTDNPKGSVTFTAASGYTIETITVTYKSNSSGSFNVASGTEVTVNASTYTYNTTAGGNVGITAITVKYAKV